MRLSDLIDPPVQKVIAGGRVLLTGVALLGVELDPTRPGLLAETRLLLIVYMAFSLCLFLMPVTFWWRFGSRFSSFEHAVDTLFVSLLP